MTIWYDSACVCVVKYGSEKLTIQKLYMSQCRIYRTSKDWTFSLAITLIAWWCNYYPYWVGQLTFSWKYANFKNVSCMPCTKIFGDFQSYFSLKIYASLWFRECCVKSIGSLRATSLVHWRRVALCCHNNLPTCRVWCQTWFLTN